MNRHIHKSSIEIRHDTRNRLVRIDQGGCLKYRLEYDESGQVTKVERHGYDDWKEPKPEITKNVTTFWEAFQILP